MGEKGTLDAKGARPRKRHYAFVKGAHENTALASPRHETPQAVDKRSRDLGLKTVVDTQTHQRSCF